MTLFFLAVVSMALGSVLTLLASWVVYEVVSDLKIARLRIEIQDQDKKIAQLKKENRRLHEIL